MIHHNPETIHTVYVSPEVTKPQESVADASPRDTPAPATGPSSAVTDLIPHNDPPHPPGSHPEAKQNLSSFESPQPRSTAASVAKLTVKIIAIVVLAGILLLILGAGVCSVMLSTMRL